MVLRWFKLRENYRKFYNKKFHTIYILYQILGLSNQILSDGHCISTQERQNMPTKFWL